MITLPVDAGVPPSIAVEVEGNDLKLSPHWEVRGVGYALGAACGHSTSPHTSSPPPSGSCSDQ